MAQPERARALAQAILLRELLTAPGRPVPAGLEERVMERLELEAEAPDLPSAATWKRVTQGLSWSLRGPALATTRWAPRVRWWGTLVPRGRRS